MNKLQKIVDALSKVPRGDTGDTGDTGGTVETGETVATVDEWHSRWLFCTPVHPHLHAQRSTVYKYRCCNTGSTVRVLVPVQYKYSHVLRYRYVLAR